MQRRLVALVLALTPIGATACSDTIAPARTPSTVIAPSGGAAFDESEGRGVFQRYVAIGTSLSMGWQSDGVIAATQETSWPAQLAAMAHRSITQPYIDLPGCRSPLVAPLASGKRLSGEGAGANTATLSCAPLRADVVEPVQNLAINAATTYDALFTTPENTTDDSNRGLIGRVLQPGMTQVSSMVAQNPKLVSVELGGNEVLNARAGYVLPGTHFPATVVPYDIWAPQYDAVLDQVQAVAKEAVIVGLINDVGSFPAFRRGAEIAAAAARGEFAMIGVTVSPKCGAENSANLLFVPVLVPFAAATHGTIDCADHPAAADFVLTPTDVAALNQLIAQMNAHIQSEAERRGFAYFALESLYGRPDIKAPFSPLVLLGTSQPYGPLISLDGVHPTAAGARILAEAAAHAMNTRYNHHIPEDEPALIATR